MFLSPEQVIGETVLNAEICLGTLLVDQALNLVQPPPPILVGDEQVWTPEILRSHDPKRVGGIGWGRKFWEFSIDPGAEFVLNLWVTKTEGNLSMEMW